MKKKSAKWKIILFVGLGVVVLLIVISSMGFIQSQMKNILFSFIPELRPIDRVFTRYYPDYQVGYFSSKNTFYSNAGAKTTNRLTVSLASSKDLPPRSEYGKAGRLACLILLREKKHYDVVTIRFQKSYGVLGISPFHYSMSYNGSCESWLDKK
jgi:hypothetical protein